MQCLGRAEELADGLQVAADEARAEVAEREHEREEKPATNEGEAHRSDEAARGALGVGVGRYDEVERAEALRHRGEDHAAEAAGDAEGEPLERRAARGRGDAEEDHHQARDEKRHQRHLG